jgi:hypothetical protein
MLAPRGALTASSEKRNFDWHLERIPTMLLGSMIRPACINRGAGALFEVFTRRDPPMRRLCYLFVALLALVPAMPNRARAENLVVVEVNAPAVNCVFQPTCTITVNDSIGQIALPFIAVPGTAWLQSRTFTGAPGTPAAGQTGYMYRVSLTEASGNADCLGGLVLNFGPVTKLPYKPGVIADVFVITTGGLGTISLSNAVKTGNVIEFTFSKSLCLSGPPSIANTTFFFGLAGGTSPSVSTAGIWAMGNPSYYEVAARVPTH